MSRRTLPFVLSVLFCAASAQAQLPEKRVKLSLDTSLLAWDYHYLSEEDYSIENKSLSLGVFSTGGIAVGYSCTRRLAPQLYLSVSQDQASHDRKYEDGGYNNDYKVDALKYEVRPSLEVALGRDEHIVPYLLAGISVVGTRFTVRPSEGNEATVDKIGVGGALGLGVHGFVLSQASIDVSLAYRLVYVVDGADRLALEPASKWAHAVFINAGVSLWL